MAELDFVDPFVNSPVGTAEELTFSDPGELARRTKPPITAAWKLLAGAITLRAAGQTSDANAWFNALTKFGVPAEHDLLSAEMLAEGGKALYADGHTADALSILSSATGAWQGVCDRALQALQGESSDAVTDLARQIATLAKALGVHMPTGGKGARSATQAPAVVRQWLEERGVSRRADVFATFVRALIKGGDTGSARKISKGAVDWTTSHFASSDARAGVSRWSGIVPSSAHSRLALYTLALAQGEVEQADEQFQRSADAFAGAALLYDGHIENATDINRLLQAKANEANAILRLARYDDAIAIYDLVEHGFNSLGDTARAQRVAQARLFAQTKKLQTHAT